MAVEGQAAPRKRRNGRHKQQGSGWIIVAALASLVLLIGAVIAAAQGGTANGPAVNAPAVVKGGLKIDPGEINMGDVKLGRTVDASFKIENVGNQTITIKEQPYVELVKGC